MTSWCVEREWSRREARTCRWWLTVGAALLFWAAACFWWTDRLDGHVPVPTRVLDPQSAPEAWNVLRLASTNIDRLMREGRLAEIPDQASLCPPSLRLLARLAQPGAQGQRTAIGTVRVGTAISSLAQTCVAGDRDGASVALAKFHAALDSLSADEDARIVQAEVFFCPMHPEVLSVGAGGSCPKCGMSLLPRRIPYSFVYASPPGEPSMAMSLNGDAPVAGRSERVVVRLTKKDGAPVEEADLLTVHTRKIHLLVIDPTLEDYHHEHPEPTGVPGEYQFTFTPHKTSAYRVYADVVPAMTGIQEYIPADLPHDMAPVGSGTSFTRWESCLESEAEGLRFRLQTADIAGQPLRAGQAQSLRLTVTNKAGQPMCQLQPVMNAFAHLVGFYEDGRTVVHLHPAGMDVEDLAQRGGPSLEFRFYPPKAGFLKLYCQVSVGGEMIYAPFVVNVAP